MDDVNKSKHDLTDLSDLTFDGLVEDEINSFNLNSKSQLCIPQDRLEDLEFFPNFKDDLMSLNGVLLPPEHDPLFFDEASPNKDVSFHRYEFVPNTDFGSLETKTEEKKREKDADDNDSKNAFGEVVFSRSSSQETKDRKRKMNGGDINSTRNFAGGKIKKKSRSKRPQGKKCSRIWKIEKLGRRYGEGLGKFYSCAEGSAKRRCTHCETENTPQWREGPMGPKTLCNACGVRYKSGRLLPEYRPAASPSFDNMKHSNFHRKILQRKYGAMKKEKDED